MKLLVFSLFRILFCNKMCCFLIVQFFMCQCRYLILNAQPTCELKYSYLHSRELDKILQTYNFARPWQDAKLLPLTNGYGANIGWNFKLSSFRQLHIVPQIGYQRFGSMAENFDMKKSIGFHLIGLGFNFRFHPRALLKGIQSCGPLGPRWFLTAGVEYSFYVPFVKMNKEKIELEEGKKYHPLTSSFQLAFGSGYHAWVFKNLIFTPEISITWVPYLELDNFAQAVNGHNVTRLNNVVPNVFFLKGSMRITRVKSGKNWWDRPYSGDKN